MKALVATVGLALTGCTIVSQPPRPFTADDLQEGSGPAYLWSAGRVKQPVLSMQDYAVVTRIGDKAIPPEYRPAATQTPEGFMQEAAGKIGAELSAKRKAGSVTPPSQ